MIWVPTTLPGCFGQPCEEAREGDHVARVWQASKVTARGVWCWSLDGSGVHVVRGNRGIAKVEAGRAMRRALR